jgi:hypothetical protein
MSAGAIIILVIVLVLIAAVAAIAGTTILRRMALRRRFGAEYDRLASEVGPRRAHAELAERRRRVEELNLRPLTAEKQAGYGREWTAVQERFVDNPAQTARDAAALVTAVAADCGYSVADPDRFLTDLSVFHSPRLEEYRRARETTERAGAPTEDLRRALLGHRAMFLDLLWAPDNAVDRPDVPAGTGDAATVAASTAGADMAGSGASASAVAADAAGDRTMAQPTKKG